MTDASRIGLQPELSRSELQSRISDINDVQKLKKELEEKIKFMINALEDSITLSMKIERVSKSRRITHLLRLSKRMKIGTMLKLLNHIRGVLIREFNSFKSDAGYRDAVELSQDPEL